MTEASLSPSSAPAEGPPPGPRSRILHMVEFFRDPLACYRRLRARWGDPFTVPFLLGNRMVVSGRPPLIKEIFAAPADAYVAVDKTGEVFVGRHSVILLDGDEHRRMRDMLMAPLVEQRGHGNGPMIRDVALRHARSWPAGEPFRLLERMRKVSLEVILRTVYGMVDERRMAEFAQAFKELHGAAGFWVVFVPALRRDLGPWSPWRRFTATRARCDRIIYEDIAAARARGHDPNRLDVLNHLVGLRDEEGRPAISDEEIRDNLFTMLFAGHESTATALTWAVYWTLRTPGVLDRLRNELAEFARTGDTSLVARNAYVDAVCREALRIHPVSTNVARRLRCPMTMLNRRLPEGTVVSASIDLAHHDPDIYPDPDAFRPERFLERRYGISEFLPFGGGRRHCLGANLGLEEMRIVLAVVVTTLDLGLLEPKPVRPVWKAGTMAPRTGVRVRVVGIRSAAESVPDAVADTGGREG